MLNLWPATVLLAVSLSVYAEAQCPAAAEADYDYIVVGSGAGGGPVASRLAEEGFDVLVVDAGHDINSVNTTIPLYFTRSVEDEALELAYTLNEYPPEFEHQKTSWYPRAGALGGSTIHNALINILAETTSDFDALAKMFDDPTWTRESMQEYFKKIERRVYPVLPGNAQDHGTSGWLTTNMNPVLIILEPQFLDLQTLSFVVSVAGGNLLPVSLPHILDLLTLENIVSELLNSIPLLIDLNSVAGDDAIGITLPSFTTTEEYRRSSVRDRLVDVRGNGDKGSLTFMLDTLATKVLVCNDSESGGALTAYGVEVAPGAFLPVAAKFHGKQDLTVQTIRARKEVIVSAGTFQSPQLLMLSGIGPREHLENLGIETLVDLPGVGTNMQDHDEISVIWKMKEDFSLFDGCTFLPTPEQDPCLAYYLGGKPNIYSFGGNVVAVTSKSRKEYTEPDMLTYWAPAYFEGFVRGFGQKLAETPNAVTAIHLKAHPSSIGSVRLTGSHPQDLLDIQKNRFQGPEGRRDVEDLRDAIKHSREVMATVPISLFVEEEVFPGKDARSDEEIENHVYENIFGHHICCTNPMGTDDDAVLDGDFRVRGVKNLRVVDASSFPVVPGYFVTTPIYMISEKAADVIIAAAKSAS